MAIRTHAVFSADFDRTGNADFPAGEDLAEHIRRCVSERGLSVTPVDLLENYGWCFEAVSHRVPVWVTLQSYEPWLLVVQVYYPLIHWLRRRRPTDQQERVRRIIDETLASSARFWNVRWFTRQEFRQFNRNAPAVASG